MTKPRSKKNQPQSMPPDREHIVPWLLGQLTQANLSPQLIEEELARGAQHLLTCQSCKSSLALLESAVASLDIAALLTHAAQDTDPSDEELATYAAMQAQAGASVAARRFPDIAAHMQRCQMCRESVEETTEMLTAWAAENAAEVAEDIAAAHVPLWEQVTTTMRRLLEPYRVIVQRWSVRVTSALARPQIATVYAGPVRFRGAHAAAARQLEQSFAVDLCEDLAASTPWVRARVALRALSARRVSGKITTALVGFPEDEGERAAGIAWRLEQSAPEGAATPALRGGTTDAEGEADFYVRGHGAYALTFSLEGREWVVPLIIQPDPGADDTASAVPNRRRR